MIIYINEVEQEALGIEIMMKKMRSSAIISFVLFNAVMVAAQGPEIDSLEIAFRTAKSESVRFDALKNICFEMFDADSAKAEYFCPILIKDVEKIPDSVERADAYVAIGDYYAWKNDFGNSFQYFHKSMQLFRHNQGAQAEILYARCLADYAKIFHVNGDYNTALTYYLEAESIFNRYPDYDLECLLYHRLAVIYLSLNEPEKGRSYFLKQEDLSSKIASPKMKALYCIDATYWMDPKRNFDKIKELLEKSLLIGEKYSFQDIVWTSFYSLGKCYVLRNDYANSLDQFNLALNCARKLSNKYYMSTTLENISDVYVNQKKLDVAGKQLRSALEIANEINANKLRKDIFGHLAAVETSRGNYKKAYEYLDQKEEAAYAVFSEEGQRQTNFLNARYESEKKEAEIGRLTNEEKIQVIEIQRREAQTYLLSILLVLSSITFYFIWRFYKSKKKVTEQNSQIQQQRIKELEKEKQLAAVQYALQGEEKERSRLARDLHDGLGGLLSGTKLALGSFKEKYVIDGEQTDSFKHALDLLNKSIGELQRVAHNMMPQALINGSIRDAISEFCEKLDVGSSLSVKFRFFGTEEKIGQNYEIAIYRIVQELVNNVIKHSSATEALVQLVQEKGRASITVQDNGQGFDPLAAQDSEGHGLKNIRLRAESLNGHFYIDSTPGKGTEVSIDFENLIN